MKVFDWIGGERGWGGNTVLWVMSVPRLATTLRGRVSAACGWSDLTSIRGLGAVRTDSRQPCWSQIMGAPGVALNAN